MAASKPFKSKKHKMTKTDIARIFLSHMEDGGAAYTQAQSKVLGGAEGPVRGVTTDPEYRGERVGASIRGMFGGPKEVPRGAMSVEETMGRVGAMFSPKDPATLYLEEGLHNDPYGGTRAFRGMFADRSDADRGRTGRGAGQDYVDQQRLAGMAARGADELWDIEAELEKEAFQKGILQQQADRDWTTQLGEYNPQYGQAGPFMPLGGFTSEQERGIELGLLGGMAERGGDELFDIEAELEREAFQKGIRQQQSDRDWTTQLGEYNPQYGQAGPFMPLGGFTAADELDIELDLLRQAADRGAQAIFEEDVETEREEYLRAKQLYDWSDGRGMGPKLASGMFSRTDIYDRDRQQDALYESRKQHLGQQPIRRNGFTFGGKTGTRETVEEDPYATEFETDAFGVLTDRGRRQKEFHDAATEQRRYGTTQQQRDYRSDTYAEGVSGISSQRQMEIKDRARAGEDKNTEDEFKASLEMYRRLGTEIRKETNPLRRNELIKLQNEQIEIGKRTHSRLGMEGLPGVFPYVEPVSSTAQAAALAKIGAEGKISDVMTQQLGKGAGYARGQLFRGTSYASTGAINGVMKALADIFILFVFIGVFYMVFGPIYDSLIFNFTNIVSADGDPTLGGKSIPVLFDNVARVILVWVPLIVFTGALYKLTALVFEREVGTRTTEETEWDMLGAIEDSTDLDMGSDPGVFEAYGGGY